MHFGDAVEKIENIENIQIILNMYYINRRIIKPFVEYFKLIRIFYRIVRWSVNLLLSVTIYFIINNNKFNIQLW